MLYVINLNSDFFDKNEFLNNDDLFAYYLRGEETYLNNRLQTKKELLMSYVYNELGIPIKKGSRVDVYPDTGWEVEEDKTIEVRILHDKLDRKATLYLNPNRVFD